MCCIFMFCLWGHLPTVLIRSQRSHPWSNRTCKSFQAHVCNIDQTNSYVVPALRIPFSSSLVFEATHHSIKLHPRQWSANRRSFNPEKDIIENDCRFRKNPRTIDGHDFLGSVFQGQDAEKHALAQQLLEESCNASIRLHPFSASDNRPSSQNMEEYTPWCLPSPRKTSWFSCQGILKEYCRPRPVLVDALNYGPVQHLHVGWHASGLDGLSAAGLRRSWRQLFKSCISNVRDQGMGAAGHTLKI